jgi:phospho-N-acetylmuramoyl-pentapeptide-transferase
MAHNAMALNLGLLIFSFSVTAILIVPFIDMLYKLRFRRHKQTTLDAFGMLTPIFDRFHTKKAGTPVGGGLLVIIVVTLLFALLFPILRHLGIPITQNHPLNDELNIIFFTFISFGLLGLYDDILKLFGVKQSKFFGLRLRHKFIIQWLLGLIISALMYVNLSIDIVNVPFIGVMDLGALFIPIAAFIIVAFTNAVNITDGLDGLAGGILMITLFALWMISAAILDVPLSIFLALWIGSLIAFLYFNIYPARIFLGDVGALSFGATIAVIGLLIGKVMAVVVMGALFALEIISSLLQLLSKKYRGKKLFPAAPFHLWLQYIGWEEPKIVMRAWLASIMLAIFGLWLAFI